MANTIFKTKHLFEDLLVFSESEFMKFMAWGMTAGRQVGLKF